MNGTTTYKVGDTVKVPNGERGKVTDLFRKDGEDRMEVTFADETWITVDPQDVEPASERLGHCTPVWGGHSPMCDRNGVYCYLNSTHSGPCKPHGSR